MPLTSWITTEALTAGAWRCDGRHAEPAAEAGTLLLLPRGGTVVRRTDGRRATVLPATALVTRPGEPLALAGAESGTGAGRSAPGPARATIVVLGAAGVPAPRASRVRALSPAALLAHYRLQRAEHAGWCDALAREELTLELAAAIVHDAPAPPPGSTALRLAALDALAAVADAPDGAPPSLGALARTTGTTPWALSRALRRLLGVPLREYLLRRRLAVALDRLAADPARSLSAVAHDAGFASHAHFTDAVRARWGMPPRALIGRGAASALLAAPPTRSAQSL
ncbi:MAG TPA: helix-turn-helix domain-containing protein [Gemmatimonadales bacterium]|nr:helix-turn-helix domain-containing protein [Gemmatimonadales bacterium]